MSDRRYSLIWCKALSKYEHSKSENTALHKSVGEKANKACRCYTFYSWNI